MDSEVEIEIGISKFSRLLVRFYRNIIREPDNLYKD